MAEKEYEITYEGVIDRAKISLLSGIGTSDLRIGDSFSLTIEFLINKLPVVYISQELMDTEGFIKWSEDTVCSYFEQIINNDSTVTYKYKIENYNPMSKDFIKITFNELTIGSYMKVKVRTSSEKVALAFFNPRATILSPTISRISTGKAIELIDNYTGIRIFSNTPLSSNWFNTIDGSAGDEKQNESRLKWYKTNLENYYSTFCYVTNLSSTDLRLYPTIQGLVRDKGSAIWRNTSLNDNGLDTGVKGNLVIIPAKSTILLEQIVRARLKGEDGKYHLINGNILYDDNSTDKNKTENGMGLYCAITAETTINNIVYPASKVPFDKLFWRFNIGDANNDNSKCNFIILNEQTREGSLMEKYGESKAGLIRTKINQQTL